MLFLLLWLGFWVWVLKSFYRWVTRGVARAFSGAWDSLFANDDVPSWQRATYEVRTVENAPVNPQAALSAAPVTDDLERTLRAEEASATALARSIGDHRNAARDATKRASEWRVKAETAVTAARDDLARQALAEAQDCDDEATHALAVIAELQPILDSYEAEIAGLRRELEDGKRRQLVANARIERAQAGQRAARSLEPEGQAALVRATEAYERRADLAEGELEARKIGGGFGRKGQATGVMAPALPAPDTLVPLETAKRWDAAIERQLTEIKNRQGKSAA